MFSSIPETLFYIGLALTAILGSTAVFGTGDTKRGVVAVPFLVLAAAAVAKYIGL